MSLTGNELLATGYKLRVTRCQLEVAGNKLNMTRCQLTLAGNKLTLTGKALSVLHINLSAVRGRMALLRDVLAPDHIRLPDANSVLSLPSFYRSFV